MMEKFYKSAACTETELINGKYSYQKAKGKIERLPKWSRDNNGFFLPTPEGTVKHYGLMCAALGVTPSNRKLDVEHWIDNLMKEAYENGIRGLVCDARLIELELLHDFAEEDADKEREKGIKVNHGEPTASFKLEEKFFKASIPDDRRKMLDAVTWRYNWIQLYKKDCFLFAQYTIEDLCYWNGLKRFVKTLPEEQRSFIFASESNYDSEKKKCIFEGESQSDEEKLCRCHASLYWREHEHHIERERFREEFIHSYNKLPESNRFLMDCMYERAWNVISFYKFGKRHDNIPAPWYDKKEEGDA